MSDTGDLGLPSYPTLPDSTHFDPLYKEHGQTHLLPTTSDHNNSATENLTILSPSQPPGTRTLTVAGSAGNPFQNSMGYISPLPSFHGQNALVSSVYPRTSSPFSTHEDKSSAISRVPLGNTSSIDRVASGSASSKGFSVTDLTQQSYQDSKVHRFNTSDSPMIPVSTLDSASYMSESISGGECAPQDSAVSSNLTHRVQYLEKLCAKLQRERFEMEEMFGRQRKSFMNQMAHSDAQLSVCKKRIDSYTEELGEMSIHVKTKDEQLNNYAATAGATEATIREMFDADRVKYEEEIASLRKIVAGECYHVDETRKVPIIHRGRRGIWEAVPHF